MLQIAKHQAVFHLNFTSKGSHHLRQAPNNGHCPPSTAAMLGKEDRTRSHPVHRGEASSKHSVSWGTV